MLPTVKEFKALPWRQQNALMEPYVLAALQSLKEPIPTRRVIYDVANRVGWLSDTLEYLPGAGAAIGVVLTRFEIHKEGWAIQNGETFFFAGKASRRWMWQPQPKAAPLHDVFS